MGLSVSVSVARVGEGEPAGGRPGEVISEEGRMSEKVLGTEVESDDIFSGRFLVVSREYV